MIGWGERYLWVCSAPRKSSLLRRAVFSHSTPEGFRGLLEVDGYSGYFPGFLDVFF